MQIILEKTGTVGQTDGGKSDRLCMWCGVEEGRFSEVKRSIEKERFEKK